MTLCGSESQERLDPRLTRALLCRTGEHTHRGFHRCGQGQGQALGVCACALGGVFVCVCARWCLGPLQLVPGQGLLPRYPRPPLLMKSATSQHTSGQGLWQDARWAGLWHWPWLWCGMSGVGGGLHMDLEAAARERG